MKKIIKILGLAFVLFAAACSNDDEINMFNSLWRNVTQNEARIDDLEKWCSQANTNITSLQTIVNVIESNDMVTSVTPIMEGGVEIGYTITFADHDPITIYHGKDGKDGQNGVNGQDGASPIVGVAKHTNGVYYWTLNGEWLLDENGNKLRVSGANGKDGSDGADGQDGVTPQLKIVADYWWISYDNGNTWTRLGKAKGEDGADGQDGATGAKGEKGDKGDTGVQGEKGDKGDAGDSMFQSVTQDADNVYLTLADGTVIAIAKKPYLTAKPNSSDYGTVTGSGYYEPNTEVTITATPNYYTEFVQWSDGNTENPRTVTVTSDVTYTAEFNRISYTSNFTPAVFSVSADKKETFSQGNLQYHPANDEWRFAPSQLDCIGEANENISSTYNGWLDLFGWSTIATYFGVSTSTDWKNDYLGSFVDWGSNQIGDDVPNTWRTLTDDEWDYLLEERTNASSLIGIAEVNGVNGLILLPDSWTCPDGITFKSGFHNAIGGGYNYFAAYQTFTADQWSKMEAAGAVFLPAAGYRYGSDVRYVQKSGRYWSATEYDSYGALILHFASDGAIVRRSGHRDNGQSVRLVKDL